MAQTKGTPRQIAIDGDSLQAAASGGLLELRKHRDKSSDPGSPVSGETWENTTKGYPKFHSRVGNENYLGFVWEGLGSNNNGDNVGTSSTSEVPFTLSSANIAFSFPANSLAPGDTYQIFWGGRFNAALLENVQIRIRLGGVTGALIWDSGVFSVSGTNQVVAVMAQFRITSSTSARGMGLGMFTTNAVPTLSAMTIDTTSTQVLVATVQFGSSNASNLAFCSQFNCSRLGATP